MATMVVDSWALMAFFKDQPAAAEVEKILLRAAHKKHTLLLCALNWGEVYYSIMRAESQAAAEKIATAITHLPLEIVPIDADLLLVRQAALFKATKKMAYADCFAAALSKLRDVPLLTGDREFSEVEDEIVIRWLS